MHRQFTRWASLVLVLLMAFAVAPAFAQDTGNFTLTVLHTNDVHSHVEQFNANGSPCSDEEAAEQACFGGVARRLTKLNELRTGANPTILVDAGDQFQGSLFYTQYKGAEASEFMQELGYQAMAIGNHEFDDGPANLGTFLDSVNFPVLSANITTTEEPALDGKILPYTILDVNGEQIGVIGLTTSTTPESSSPGPTVAFGDYVPALEPIVAELEGQGVNKIILLSHIGYADDQTLAAGIDGIDVIVGGHSHTLLSNTEEGASGPYPTVVDAPNGNPVLIVQDGAYGKYLGNLEVAFDADGVPVSWEGDPILLDATVAEDPDVLARVQELAQPLEELRNTVIGATEADLDGDRATCRFAECTMGNLITDALLWGTQNDNTQIAFENGGGIRASISAGDVTMGNVLEVLPFGNTVATFGLTGADLLTSLENGVARAENPDNEGTGRYLQVAGMRYSWDGSKPVGERIVSAEVRGADGTYGPIDPAATYQIATNDFTRRGGDGYTLFADNAINPYDFGPPLDDVVAKYITEFSPVNVQLDGRSERVDTPAAAPVAETAAVTETAAMTETAVVTETTPVAETAPMTETVAAEAPAPAETAAEETPAAAETTPDALPVTGTAPTALPMLTSVLVLAGLAMVETLRRRTRR